MNPWEIVSNLGAACVGVLIIVMTVVLIKALILAKPNKEK